MKRHCSLECRFRNGWSNGNCRWKTSPAEKEDLQAAAIFPVVEDKEQMGTVLRWMVSEPGLTEGKAVWLESRRLSADEISAQADLRLLYAQRESFCKGNWEVLARNHAKSVFYQLDLMDVVE